MTVVFSLCLAWSVTGGICQRERAFWFELRRWDARPCAAYVPNKLRPRLLACRKIKGVLA